jgi:DNA-binding response OmpR family regulator
MGHTSGMNESVLVVDDEPMVTDVLERYLENDGFRVLTAADGQTALEIAGRARPDVVLLDLMLPGLDGLTVLRGLAHLGPPRVIILSARGDESDRLLGLEVGADDYVVKPFSPREVVARVRAVLRRGPRSPGVPLQAGDIAIDIDRRTVEVGGSPVELARKEFDLLAYLAANPHRVLTRTQLLDAVWGHSWIGSAETVTVHVRRLREKIEGDPPRPRHVVTVRGVGYRFEP